MLIYATYDRLFSDNHLKDYSISIKLLQAIACDTYFGISANNNSFLKLLMILMIRIYHICNTSRCRVSLH